MNSKLKPPQVKEIAPTIGGLCWSALLTQHFEQYIRGVIGDKVFDRLQPRSKDRIMHCWEEVVMIQFPRRNIDWGYFVEVPKVPDSPDMNIEDGCHIMGHDEFKKIFDPVVDRMISLLKQQVTCVRDRGDDISAIVLYGEFISKCYYLRKRLESVDYESGKSILVLLVPNELAERSCED
ncbi:hypothetical protein BDD12DRAFT_802448 [Trichophaea hybrida]|nr:hypothetical protein BDD12DRAFT_802448 [Trichophaea hybrida]